MRETGDADREVHEARVTIRFGDEADARVVSEALRPEAGEDLPRARAAITRDGAHVTIELDAQDLVSLRAGINSYLRWARCAHDAVEAAHAAGSGESSGG